MERPFCVPCAFMFLNASSHIVLSWRENGNPRSEVFTERGYYAVPIFLAWWEAKKAEFPTALLTMNQQAFTAPLYAETMYEGTATCLLHLEALKGVM